ncbi:MAG TPA: serine hydrolase domain-containing protein [Gaiellales bacterium]|nr:serine hydrolase domain-containing protein [Gaiellales bacterium]
MSAAGALAAYADAVVRSGCTPGAAVAATSATGTLFAVAAGHAEPAAALPMRTDTLGLIGSISKSATALLVLRQAELGAFDLSDPVDRHLPWFHVHNPHGAISIRHLLMHTAGLPMDVSTAPPSAGLVALLAEVEPAWPPGLRHHYSNVGYAALGLMLEAVVGEPFPIQLQRGVLDRLGMSASLPVVGDGARGRLAVGHVPRDPERGWAPDNPLVTAPWVPYEASDGSICSTVLDMCAYARMILDRGAPLVSPATFAVIVSDTVDDGEGGRYGYGLATQRVDGAELVGHSGGMVGHHAQLFCDPAAGIAAVALVNGDRGQRQLAAYALALARADAGGGPPPPAPEPPEPAPPGPPGCGDHALAGVYRAHDPWLPVVRVVAAGESLTVHAADAPAARLAPAAGGDWMLVVEGLRLPERVRFDLPVDGRMQRLWWNGCGPYYRAAV